MTTNDIQEKEEYWEKLFTIDIYDIHLLDKYPEIIYWDNLINIIKKKYNVKEIPDNIDLS